VAVAGPATGVWRRRLWAAYVLALAELLKFAGGWAASGAVPAFVAPLISLAGAMVLTSSASELSPEISTLPLKRRLIAGLAAYFAIPAVSTFVATLIQVKFNLSTVTENNLEGAIKYALCVIGFAVAAKRAPWSFETALSAAIVAFAPQILDGLVTSAVARQLLTSGTVISLSATGIALIACGVLGEGIAVALSPFKPELSPEFVETLKEWERAMEIQAVSAGHEEKDSEILRRLLFSRALFALALRDPETAEVYGEMFEVEPTEENIGEFVKKSFRLLTTLSKKARRRFPPLSLAENVQFLIDQLRTAGYTIIRSKPTDDGRGSECEVICGHAGCFVIDRVLLSEQEEQQIRSGRASHLCASHQT
jgi:hypothetical protein